MPSTISKPRRTEDGSQPKPAVEPRAMPTFVSTLKAEETDFPRGGGTSLTALEVKQTRDEGRKEAEAEDRADVSPLVSWHGQADDSLRKAQRRGSHRSVRGTLRGSRRTRSRLAMTRIRTVSVSSLLHKIQQS